MSIKTQKIISFIPIVNILVIGIQWLLFYHRNAINNRMCRIIGKLLIASIACLIPMIAEIIVDSLLDNALIETTVNLLVSFAYAFIFSIVMIYDQEKYYKKK